MMRMIGAPLLALCGFGFAIFMIFRSAQRPTEAPLLFKPAQSPYEYYVAGEGIIESYNENVNIGVSFPDLVWEVPVRVGEQVKKGDLLFKIDTRQQEADLYEAYRQLQLAKTEYLDRAQQFSYYEKLDNKAAVSQREYTEAYYAKQAAIDRVKIALAQVNQLRTTIERAHIRAPYDGQILQENTRIGEFANVNPFDREPLMIFGSTHKLQLRVNISEEDAWRVMPEAEGMAYVRGNPDIQFHLNFKYIEPLLMPKEMLTGSDFERVDTRVLQVVYEFDKGNSPVYVGQLLDVYLEAKPSNHA